MTRNNLIFGGVNSRDFGVWISGSDTYAAPERDTEHVSVPGRNGDLIIDNGRWKNKQVTYPAFFPYNFPEKMEAFRAAICRKLGYQRLEDSYHPDEYRMAEFVNGITPTNMAAYNKSGDFRLTFNCKPQRFLKSGDEPIQFIPPIIFAGEMSCGYIPVNGSVTYTMHGGSEELMVQIHTYDAQGTIREISTEYCYSGDTHTKTFAADDKYFSFAITGAQNYDNIWFDVVTTSLFNGEAFPINAVFGKKWTIQNPTGYPTAPLIEAFSNALPYMTISNYADGEEQEYYVFHSNQAPVTHFYMDCEMQYLYGDDRQNLTSYLFLTTATSAMGKGLVFPKFGEDQIELEFTYSEVAFGNGIGLIQIYPRWWLL